MIKSLKYGVFLYLVMVLCCLPIVAFSLYANPIIDERNRTSLEANMRRIFNNGEVFHDVTADYNRAGYSVIEGIYKVEKDHEVVSYTYKSRIAGRNGDIVLLIAYDKEQFILDFVVLEQKETKGLGDKITAPEYRDLIKGQNANNFVLDTISKATISSTAVRKALIQTNDFEVKRHERETNG